MVSIMIADEAYRKNTVYKLHESPGAVDIKTTKDNEKNMCIFHWIYLYDDVIYGYRGVSHPSI